MLCHNKRVYTRRHNERAGGASRRLSPIICNWPSNCSRCLPSNTISSRGHTWPFAAKELALLCQSIAWGWWFSFSLFRRKIEMEIFHSCPCICEKAFALTLSFSRVFPRFSLHRLPYNRSSSLKQKMLRWCTYVFLSTAAIASDCALCFSR